MPRGAELYNWVEENEMAVLNDGKPTRAARFQQGCGLRAADITIVNSEAADRFIRQPLNELSSDHSPILIKWNQLVKTERAQRRVRPNFQKADWNLFRARLAEYRTLLEAVTDPTTKLKTFVDCVQKAAAIAVPQKVCRKKETPWMNAELRTNIQNAIDSDEIWGRTETHGSPRQEKCSRKPKKLSVTPGERIWKK